MSAVILQKGVEEKTVVGFPVFAAMLGAPFVLNFGDVTAEPRSAEAVMKRALEPEAFDEAGAPVEKAVPEVRATLDADVADARVRFGMTRVDGHLSEHLALVSRWFYSKPRDGEILFKGVVWPYRRIMRACSRILAPPPETRPVETAPN